MNILELYSGIGGMHMAFKESGITGKIIAAVEINTIANEVYKHNFPNTLVLNKNIQGLTSKFINKLNVNTILMSPPCQPFTRNGLKKDELDNRSCSFSHILDILPELNIKYILIENVKGFESSMMRNKFIETLKNCNFIFQEYLLSPTQIGVSNTRLRYYCIAKRKPLKFHYDTNILEENLPEMYKTNELFTIQSIIETNMVDDENYLLSDETLLKRATLLDICNPNSKRSCCFTKAYGKYTEGTGSVFTPKSSNEISDVYEKLKQTNENQRIACLKILELRLFTPKEISRLMSFPEYFNFPNDLTIRQKYKLLGNSINVKIVSILLKMLI